MNLRLTSATGSGIQKRSATSKSRPSPFATHARRKPTSAAVGRKPADLGLDEPLGDIGRSDYISHTARVGNVEEAIKYIGANIFDELPERAGMNSTRIAEVLNLRRSLPPLASVAHIHTLIDAPTQVEREIVELVKSGRVRRLIVPGRGNDAADLGDCLVLAEAWENLIRDSTALDIDVKEKFIDILNRMENCTAISQSIFTDDEYRALMRAGFLVSSSIITQGSMTVASLPNFPNVAFSSASRREPNNPFETDRPVQKNAQARAATLFLSLPNTGTYMRLLSSGRDHLIALLRRSSYAEAPLSILKDRWEGAVETNKSYHQAKLARGEFAGILPGKTKRWKDLYGMNFNWIVEEALGAGLVELFETGSVGPGIRCL